MSLWPFALLWRKRGPSEVEGEEVPLAAILPQSHLQYMFFWGWRGYIISYLRAQFISDLKKEGKGSPLPPLSGMLRIGGPNGIW